MIIENQGNKFYVPDNIGNDKTKSVADVFASAIPYDDYITNLEISKNLEKINAINNDLDILNKEPDEILVINENKFNRIKELEEEKNKLILLNKELGV